MPYFTLNYITPTLQNAAPCFTVTEEQASLTSSQVQSLHAFICHILSNHLICTSVPPSFPLDPTCHHNTILILQDAIHSIILTLKATPLQIDNHAALEALEKTFSYDLLQVDLTEFEQPLPIVTKDIVPLNIPLTSSPSYNLPFIEISPDGRRFTLTSYPVTIILDYLEYLHQGVEYVLENRIFLADQSTATMTSPESLANHSLLALLQLLINQSTIISLINNETAQQDIKQSNNNWISRLITDLKYAGFSDASLTKIWQNSLPKEQVSDLALQLKKTSWQVKKTSSALQKTTHHDTASTLIPLFSITEGPATVDKESFETKTIYECKYSVRKINTNASTRYLDVKKSIITSCEILKKIYASQEHLPSIFNYTHPFSRKISTFNSTEALFFLFEGLSENFYFLSNNFPLILKDTRKNCTKSILKESLEIAKKQLTVPVPEISPHILQDMLDPKLTISLDPITILTAEKKIHFLPIFSIRLCISGYKISSKGRGECYLTQYTLLKTSGRQNNTCTIARLSIKTTEKHVKYLCSNEYKESSSLKYVDPFSKSATLLPLNKILPLILQGLRENINFLPLQIPSIFKHTKLYRALDSLNNCVDLINNRLGSDAPRKNEAQTPSILKKLFNYAAAKSEPAVQTDDLSV
ncbi:hypothetical protein CLAVI_000997 [Candidatus Clavichlamydia salmonicola]|uniref:hypothetical protein n=1 Tax=Candidatus Clavichlamydia salmonicola TaxID=469812 RepID=UPI0018911FC4|nr:hypothetical protein [Candidatus Clavichlamydia salmonicola]MBF5051354.1 hypothetical protein [Candidatus Clavichlamydia salmonicola]